MKVDGKPMRPIWEADVTGERVVRIIDQTSLPFAFETADLRSEADAARAKAGIAKEGEEDGPLAEMLKGLTKG